MFNSPTGSSTGRILIRTYLLLLLLFLSLCNYAQGSRRPQQRDLGLPRCSLCSVQMSAHVLGSGQPDCTCEACNERRALWTQRECECWFHIHCLQDIPGHLDCPNCRNTQEVPAEEESSAAFTSLLEKKRDRPTVLSKRIPDAESMCAVCLEEESDVSLPCGHCFHECCVAQWFSKRKNCPVCRKASRWHEVRRIRDGSTPLLLTADDLLISPMLTNDLALVAQHFTRYTFLRPTLEEERSGEFLSSKSILMGRVRRWLRSLLQRTFLGRLFLEQGRMTRRTVLEVLRRVVTGLGLMVIVMRRLGHHGRAEWMQLWRKNFLGMLFTNRVGT